jgi:ketosteroid isomerase-like protein
MTTQQIANDVAALCRQGKFEEAQNKYYSSDVKSIEPEHAPRPQGSSRAAQGMPAIKQKGQMFHDMVEQNHGIVVSGPIVAGDWFSIGLNMDITMKGQGRSQMDEIIVYHVKDGKIVQEEFFY